jgi:nucleoside-diphosphate-sugar epimerase
MGSLHVGVLGASSLVGGYLTALLAATGRSVTAFSRRKIFCPEGLVAWQPLSVKTPVTASISHWISLVPIWVLPEYGDWLTAHGARRLVALSSTSRFVKKDAQDPHEHQVARSLAKGESYLRSWGASRGVDWIVLRPTLVYGNGKDQNISEIAAIVRRFRFFPLMGRAQGKRQPVHAQDVAAACIAALDAGNLVNRAYNLAGGETLTYRDMVYKIFIDLGRTPVMPTLPGWVFHIALTGLRVFPRYRHWTMGMVERMNQDLVFDASEAAADFGYRPQKKFRSMRFDA